MSGAVFVAVKMWIFLASIDNPDRGKFSTWMYYVVIVGPPGTDHITTHGLASWPELRVTEDAHENLD